MERTLEDLAAYLKGRVIGDGSILIRSLNSLEAAAEGDLTFAVDDQQLARALAGKASAIIVSSSVKELPSRSGISVPNPKLAFALLLEIFHPSDAPTGIVHRSAVIGSEVHLGEQVDVRAHAVLGDRVRIGRGTIIESGVSIGHDVSIGEGCLIGPNVVIYRQTLIGDRVRIHAGSAIGGDGFGYVLHDGRYVKVPQVGNVVIEDDVEIGCNVCVDRATVGSTVIQRGTKIDNLVQIAHNDRIGRHVTMSGQVGLSGSVTVGDYARFGGKAGVIDHITIGPKAEVGAASVVTRPIEAGEKVWGYPARSVRSTLRQMASLNRLPDALRSLADLVRRLTRVERRLKALEGRKSSDD
jgi:UDP-3-O-[3-hydroxymyristoyl] glucosamine N-acyltransferase